MIVLFLGWLSCKPYWYANVLFNQVHVKGFEI